MGLPHMGRDIPHFFCHLDKKVRWPPQALEESRLFLEDILALEGDDDPGRHDSQGQCDCKVVRESLY